MTRIESVIYGGVWMIAVLAGLVFCIGYGYMTLAVTSTAAGVSVLWVAIRGERSHLTFGAVAFICTLFVMALIGTALRWLP